MLRDIAAEHKAKKAKVTHERWLADSRKESRMLPTQPLDFSTGGCVFVEPGCLDAFEGDAAAVSLTIRQNNMRRVDDPIDAAAGFIIAPNLKDAGRTNRWVAVFGRRCISDTRLLRQ